MGDLRDMVESADSAGLDLADIPHVCTDCPDAVVHSQHVVAGHADDADDARLLMQMLGLVDSGPTAPRTEWGMRSRPRSSRARNATANDTF